METISHTDDINIAAFEALPDTRSARSASREVRSVAAGKLHLAAQLGQEKIVDYLLSVGLTSQGILEKDAEGNTAFHQAAFGGSTSILIKFKNLLPDGVDVVNMQNFKKMTPLHLAAGNNQSKAVEFLLSLHAHKDVRNAMRAVPFHYAARNGNKDMMEMLFVDENFDDNSGDARNISGVDIRSENGLTALHYASRNGHLHAVEWLLMKGASIKTTDDSGNGALHFAIKNGHTEVIRFLLKKRADICAFNLEGKSPLDLVDEWKREPTVQSICRILDDMYRTSLDSDSLGTNCGRNEITNLIKNGKLLHYVAGYGRKEDVEWVVARISEDHRIKETQIADLLSIRGRYDRTPLHWAAQTGNIPTGQTIIQSLARIKADLQLKDMEGVTPLTHALVHQQLPFAKTLIQLIGPSLSSWQWMENWRHANHAKVTRDVVDLSLIPHPRSMPSLWIALSIGEESIALMMQMYNKDAVNQKDEIRGRTSLHWAVILKQNQVVCTLCRKEEFSQYILPSVEDEEKKTALQYALDWDHGRIRKELMQTKTMRSWLEGLYQDRQVYVDAANAILVGAALIASITFAGWLQPPLGNISQSYRTHIGVRIFWSFNSLSFFFSIATMLVGTGTVLPTSEDYIPEVVSIIKRNLFYTAFLFAISIFFVLGAFAAGVTVLPSGLKQRKNMIVITLIGGITCLLSCGWFFFRLFIMGHNFKFSWSLHNSQVRSDSLPILCSQEIQE